MRKISRFVLPKGGHYGRSRFTSVFSHVLRDESFRPRRLGRKRCGLLRARTGRPEAFQRQAHPPAPPAPQCAPRQGGPPYPNSPPAARSPARRASRSRLCPLHVHDANAACDGIFVCAGRQTNIGMRFRAQRSIYAARADLLSGASNAHDALQACPCLCC